MHALYYFLTDEAVAEDALSCVECRYGSYMDADNWYSPVWIWTDGCREVYDADGKKTGVEEYALSDMLNWVMRAAAYDLRLYGAPKFTFGAQNTDVDRKIAELGYADLASEIRYMTPRMLSDLYADAVGSKDASHERADTAIGYERALCSNFFPFSRHVDTPYAWRCYDLCYSELKSEEGISSGGSIVVLDIHT